MKTPNLLLILSVLLLSVCSTPNEPNSDNNAPKIDETLTKKPAVTEAEAIKTVYETFYKPANAVVGDPMTYYNEADQTFYVFFLLGRFFGYPGGGIYVTKTKDFAKFLPLNIPSSQILTGQPGEWDINMGTGDCIKKDNNYHFFYTVFTSPSTVSKATLASDLSSGEWYKKPSFKIQPPVFCKNSEFRDPDVYWDDTRNKYVMLVGGQTIENRAVLARYQSDDLNTWEEIQGLYKAADNNNPKIYEFPTDTDIPECAEVFKLGNKWYMIFSRINRDNHRKTFYRIANSPDGPWEVCKDENGLHETFDGLWLYAAKTSFDGQNRYLSGWASTGQDRQTNPNELAWGGNLITHKLIQQPSGKLYPTIPDAVNAKFKESVDFKNIKQKGVVEKNGNTFTLSGNSQVVFNRNTSSLKIEMKIDASQAEKGFGIGFGAYEDQTESYNLTFDMTSNNQYNTPALFMCQNNKELNFTPLIVSSNKQFDIKIVIEKQVCVMYVNGNVAFTNHISTMEQNPWMIFNNSGVIKFSDIKIFK
ncbi:MAG: DUF4975 domain-containing protein [Bacteroidales bacterium]|nr:DUF4975 domain-containing protein [Bacteroidales bacterium]